MLNKTDPARRFALLHQIEQIGNTAGDRSAQDAVQADMAALLERHPDDASQARLLICRALLAERRGDRSAFERHARLAVGLAEQSADAWAAAQSCNLLVWLHTRRREFAVARDFSDRALAWAGRIEVENLRDEIESTCLRLSTHISVGRSRFDEARGLLQQQLVKAEAGGSLSVQANVLHLMIGIAQHSEMLVLAERMLKLARSMGAPQRVAAALYCLGAAAESLGDSVAAIHWYEQGLPACRAAGDRVKEALILFGLGRVYSGMGDATAALQWHIHAQVRISAHRGRHFRLIVDGISA